MDSLLSTRSRRLGFGLCLVAWTLLQLLFSAVRGLHLTSVIGISLQMGIAAAFIYSGMAIGTRRHST